MYHLTIYSHFAAAHNLLNYEGECENLHGHNWKVELTVQTRTLDDAGLGIDFKILKQKLKAVLGRLDHVYINELEEFRRRSPSSENLARHIYERMETELKGTNVTVERVNVWESENACAAYTAD